MKDWRYWWTMPVLLFAGPVGAGVDPSAIATLPPVPAAVVTAAYVASWAVLAFAGVLTGLWALDRALEARRSRQRVMHR